MSKEFEKYLSRRMMGDSGWMFFCVQCGMYKDESEFNKNEKTNWGLASSCKVHKRGYRNRKKGLSTGYIEEEEDNEMDYLKLTPLTEDDFIETQKTLERMGYTFGQGKTVHEQFMEKYGKQINKKNKR